MSWSQILAKFDGEWVELIEYDWNWESPYPRWAKVRNHSPSRAQLSELLAASGPVTDSITLYLGAVESLVDRSNSAVMF